MLIKVDECSTQMNMKLTMPTNVKMPTIVGILTCISMINTTFASLTLRLVLSFQHFSFSEQFDFAL